MLYKNIFQNRRKQDFTLIYNSRERIFLLRDIIFNNKLINTIFNHSIMQIMFINAFDDSQRNTDKIEIKVQVVIDMVYF